MSETVGVDEPRAAERAVEVLREGQLVVLPTDTTYGVAADAFQPAATQALFAVRNASRDTPLPVFIRSPRQLIGLTEDAGEQAQRLVAAFWPGPLTMVFTAGEALTWDLGETQGTVAIRLPAHDFVQELIAAVGPLAVTGANTVATLPPSTVAGARAVLGDRVALYVDGGRCDGGPSTIVDVSRGGAEVLRRGAVTADAVFEAASGATEWGAPTPGPEPGPEEAPEEASEESVEEASGEAR
ncbi:MAG: threonylcarbamoyl-AMP synthase [Euzebyales bacterium]|nr:threonylcarbamoyl-AMP synthase [Euzebyales bacterium]